MIQSAAAEKIEPQPQSIGPYRILGLLGEGGMGVVYRAAHVETGELVALKTVHTSNERMLASIRREIHALSRLRHPGVVRIVGEGVHEALPWYAMELLEGLTLLRFARSRWNAALATAATLAGDDPSGAMSGVDLSGEYESDARAAALKSRLPVDVMRGQPAAAGHLVEVLSLVRRLCAPLAFLHGEGIVHRDLKPENVFIRGGDVPVLVDFGLVASFEGARGRDSLELAGTTMGTPAYLAPEQIRGEVVDARADLYSLGCLLFELVTGRVPFVANSTMELVGKHLLATPTRPSELVSGVTPALDELVLRLLAKSPRDRIGHAADVASALAKIGAGADSGYAVEAPKPRAYLYRPGFTGRDEVFRKLRQPIDAAKNGVGSMVCLAGESGVGKTRLATELGRQATGSGLRVVACECVPFNVAETEGVDYNGAPLHPFARVLEAIVDKCLEFGAPETARLLGARGWVLAPYEPSVARAPGLGDFPKPPDLAAEAGRQRLFSDLAETLAAFAEERPIFLLIDDLQWADELTLAFLEWLPASYFEANPVVIFCTWRSEEANDVLRRLAAMAHVSSHELTRMDPSAVGEIAGAMLAMPKAPDGFVQFLSRQSEGNPFFVAEYLRTALAEGLLFRDDEGRWRVKLEGGDATDMLEKLPLPVSVRDLVTRRLDQLSPSCRELVAVASVLGREVQGDLFSDVGRAEASLDESAWLEAIRTLLERQVLEERMPGQFRFVHDRLREIAYFRLPEERRRALHRRVAEAIEHRSEAKGDRAFQYRALAHHWTQSAVLPKAIEYLDLAGVQALDTFANREAVAFLQEAVTLHGREGVAGDPVRSAHWQSSLAEAYLRLGDIPRCREHAERALAYCGAPLPSSTAAWALGLVVQVLVRVTRSVFPSAAKSEGKLGLEAANSLFRMFEVFLYGDDPMRAFYCGVRNINVASSLPPSSPLARGLAMMAVMLAATPMRSIGAAWTARSLDIAETLNSPGTLAYCLSRAGVSRIQEARWAEAEEALRRGVELCKLVGDSRQLEECRFILGAKLFYCGTFAESLALATESTRASAQRNDEQTTCWGRIEQAQALVRLGRTGEAIAILEKNVAWVDAKATSFETIWSYGVLALARVQSGDDAGARSAADRALDHMLRKRPVVYGTQPAIAGVAYVYNALAEKSGGEERAKLLARAEEVGKVFEVFAWMFVFARPANLLHKGKRQLLAGSTSRALSTWRRGLKLARELNMPYEEVHLRRELALHDPAADRRAELQWAAERLAAMEAAHDLASVRELLAEGAAKA